MSGDSALQLLSQMLWVGVSLVSPLLIIVMLVGIVVSIFQVVTQIQEVSLSFIPKIFTVVAVLAIFGPWMLKRLVRYSVSIIASIPGYL